MYSLKLFVVKNWFCETTTTRKRAGMSRHAVVERWRFIPRKDHALKPLSFIDFMRVSNGFIA
jgi:hypothetical protein